MRVPRAVWWLVPGLALVGGCGESSEGGDGGANDADEPEVDWSKANPPANVDITTCAAIREAEDPELDACSACCNGAGFSGSSFLNDGRCTCANNRDDGRETVCMTDAARATDEVCVACCETAGFSGHAWLGGGPATSVCRCAGRSDTVVCASSVEGDAGFEACSFCCLNQGFLSNGYGNFGGEECRCIDP